MPFEEFQLCRRLSSSRSPIKIDPGASRNRQVVEALCDPKASEPSTGTCPYSSRARVRHVLLITSRWAGFRSTNSNP